LHPKKPSASTIDAERRVFTLSRDYPADHYPKWYLSSDPLYGDVTLKVIATLPLEDKQLLDPKVIGALIQLIANKGSIGAKPQMGLGIIRVLDRQSTQPLLSDLKQLVAKYERHKDRNYHDYDELPSLHNMFFARVNVDRTSASESDTFDLKYDIRGMFRQVFKDVDLRHTIMGSVHRENRQGAKIMMSYPYDNGVIRIWGWIPKLPGTHPSRNQILDEIYSLLEDIYRDNFNYWLDFNPNKQGDIVKYLEEHILKEEK
jgi:CRISPR-associated protein Cmr1